MDENPYQAPQEQGGAGQPTGGKNNWLAIGLFLCAVWSL